MCMGMGYGFLPPGADVIADLKVGDEIIIAKGFGTPAMEDAAADIVVDVHQFSALTASGVMLMCNDGLGIEKTDRHFEEGEYEISERAQTILDAVELKVALDEFSWEYYGEPITVEEAIALKALLDELKGGGALAEETRPN